MALSSPQNFTDEHKNTAARDFAAQFLYQSESQKQFFFDEARFETFCKHFDVPDKSRSYLHGLVSKVFTSLTSLDALIESKSDNWKVTRMASMDRIILRIAAAELLEKKTPPKVVLDEAIELAKKYGTGMSSGFVNGILDSLLKSLE